MEKRGENYVCFRSKRGFSFNMFLFILIGIGLIFLLVNYIFLFTKFSIGDFVYDTQGSLEAGQIEGINVLTGNYVVKWNSGEYSNEFFWDIGKLSDLEGYDVVSLGLNKKSDFNSFNYDFQKEDNFSDYVLSLSDDGGTLVYDDYFYLNYTLEDNCNPSYSCSGWGFCQANYNFDRIINNLPVLGVQYRYCVDDNFCLPNLIDSRECAFNKEILTRERVWCNKKFLEILDLNGTVLARLDNGINVPGVLKSDYLDVNINLLTNGYCPYCFNNKKDYDETGRDCGGSCIPCGQVKK